MSNENPKSLEEILTVIKSTQLSAEECLSLVIKFEDKIKADIDLLFSALAGAHIHEIQSKIGFSKNILNMVVESKGAFAYEPALQQAIPLLEDILKFYQKSGVSTAL